ncbi:NAD-dependent epimerase/dehydratase family protein [Sphingomonas morindae]|uniref:NAD-dependent epimerase/dehydratase family protein n=1 Tax=Sphingomonas morindae TaxID=1541170 RepID=A0ABY4XAR4_9SPHN|nr:NAD-dependent epimerase/dehydratase family protein [Sphingomonas morindae]USI73766.1 NAD-dependent epimerase/dehydratase family protein [Sphingomonas morindae]
MADRVALVAGAHGIIGKALLETLAETPGWRARPLGRRADPRAGAIAADLTDPAAARAALMAAGDVTHVFYAALSPRADLAEEEAVNGAMLETLLDGLAAAGAPVERVVLYQGAKVYGVHLGPVPAPFYEDDPIRPLGANFYFAQEDALRRRAAAGGPDFALLRPDVVIGDAAGNPMNIAMVIGAYAALVRAAGAAFRFPGPAQVYDGVFAQLTDAHALARASLWAATAEAARGQAFNYVHEPFRWRRIWERIGAALALPPGPPLPMTLATRLADQGPAWRRLVAAQGLVDTPYDAAVQWGFGDFVFHSAFDLVSDMGKIRRAGFAETVDSGQALLDAIARLQAARVLPR